MSCSRGIQGGSKAGVCLAIALSMQDDAVIGLNSARIPECVGSSRRSRLPSVVLYHMLEWVSFSLEAGTQRYDAVSPVPQVNWY